MFAAMHPGRTCIAFVSKAAEALGVGESYGLTKRVMPVGSGINPSLCWLKWPQWREGTYIGTQ